MEIYVQSRGIAQKHDYSWLDKDSQKRVAEPEQVKEIQHLIDSEGHSLILWRGDRGDREELLLLVTGFRASERTDFRGRTILTAVAWVGEKDDEGKLRAIAVRALQSFRGEDLLNNKISDAVQPDNAEGFKVKFEALAAEELAKTDEFKYEEPNLTSKLGIADERAAESDATSVKQPNAPENYRIAPNNDDEIKKLADELKQRKLPEGNGLLVVVTRFTPAKKLKEAGVWRGLSTQVERHEEGKWEEIGGELGLDNFAIPLAARGGELLKKFWLAGAIAIILIPLLVIMLHKQPTTKPQTPQTPQPTPQTIIQPTQEQFPRKMRLQPNHPPQITPSTW